MKHPAGALIGVDPAADLEHEKAEDANVDHVASVRPDLDAIAARQLAALDATLAITRTQYETERQMWAAAGEPSRTTS